MSDELREEYRFDYGEAKPNRFATNQRDGKQTCKASSVFVVQHVHLLDGCVEDVKLVGVYSSREKADDAVRRLCDNPGFADATDGFSVDEYLLDQDEWSEGFIEAT